MTLTEFRAANQGRKISVDIEQRWQERVVRLGMRGAEGAERYLEAYGRGIASPKVILLASRAEMANDNEMAMAFWRQRGCRCQCLCLCLCLCQSPLIRLLPPCRVRRPYRPVSKHAGRCCPITCSRAG
jgi:hypothetical protein